MKRKNIFWGVLFVLAAVFLVLGQYFGIAMSLWQMILTVFLVFVIIKSIPCYNFFGMFLPLLLLAHIYNEIFEWTISVFGRYVEIFDWNIILAVVLLCVGLTLLFKKKRRKMFCYFGNDGREKNSFNEVIDSIEEPEVTAETSFGSSTKFVKSENFRRADFKCSFGSMKIYFDNATLSPDGAVVFIENSFSGIELYIPKEWKVISNISSTFGGVDEKNYSIGSSEQKLFLEGTNSFGGIEIIYI